MEIAINRSGGIAGLFEQVGPIDTATLPSRTAVRIGHIIARMNFFHLPADIAVSDGQDLFDYTTTITEPGRSHTVHSNWLSPMTFTSQLEAVITLLEGSGIAPRPIEVTR